MLTPADGTFFPLVAGAIPRGHASGPAGLAPEALQEHGCSCKVFFAGSAGVRGVSFSRHRQYSSRPRQCRTHVFGIVCVRCSPRGVAVRRALERGPVRGNRDELFDLFSLSVTFLNRVKASVGTSLMIDPPADASMIVLDAMVSP
jgi:hypothetical protein